MTERDDWIGADRFVDDTLRYLSIADELAVSGDTRKLIEVCHVLLDRLWQRIEEKIGKKGQLTIYEKGKEREVIVTEYLEEKLIEAAKELNNGITTNNQALKTKAHSEAKKVKRELYNLTWKLNFILRPRPDAGSAYIRGRSGS